MKTILVAEDEKLIRQGLVTMIRRAPIEAEEILQARNGEQALDILHDHPVDLLITDIRMPGMDGIELVRRTQSLPHPPLAIVISGYDDFNYAVEMLRSGVKDYLLKPVERQKLYDVLQRLDEEWKSANRENENEQQMRRQALRYLMLDGTIPDAERERLVSRYWSSDTHAGYRVLYSRDSVENLHEVENVQDIAGGWAYLLSPSADTAALSGCAGLSAAHTSPAELHTAYNEALAAYRLSWFSDTAAAREYVETPIHGREIDEKELQKIVHMLGASRWQEAAASLRSLVEQVRLGNLSPVAMDHAVQELARQLLAAYRTMLPPDGDLTVISDLWRYPNAEHYLQEVRAWMEKFTQRLLQEFDDYRNKQKIRDAVLYIQKNYALPINMAVVSNEVSMNYSLFSVLFKQYVGTNFVSYLQSIRLQEARRLLRETDLRINEIGRRVGFTDDKNFLKVFKSAQGITPNEYRRASQYTAAGEQ